MGCIVFITSLLHDSRDELLTAIDNLRDLLSTDYKRGANLGSDNSNPSVGTECIGNLFSDYPLPVPVILRYELCRIIFRDVFRNHVNDES